MPLKAPKYVVSSFARFQLQQTVLILLTPAIKYQTTVRVKKNHITKYSFCEYQI
jgi:hypothetical protein